MVFNYTTSKTRTNLITNLFFKSQPGPDLITGCVREAAQLVGRLLDVRGQSDKGPDPELFKLLESKLDKLNKKCRIDLIKIKEIKP